MPVISILIFGLLIGLVVAGQNPPALLSNEPSGRVRGVSTSQSLASELEAFDPLVSQLPREVYYLPPGVNSLDQAIKALGLTVNPEDKLKFFPPLAHGVGSLVSHQRATPVTVVDANQSSDYRTWQRSVKDFLAEKTVLLGDKDRLSPSFEEPITPGLKIVITRVAEIEQKERQPIRFKTVKKDDPTLEQGKTRIERRGVNGQKELTYLINRENGQVVEKRLLSEKVIREPIDELVLLGTKVVVLGEGRATWFHSAPMTAAHNSLPRGAKVRVVNLRNGRSVEVKITGNGIRSQALIDLSTDAFAQLAPLTVGVISVRIEQL